MRFLLATVLLCAMTSPLVAQPADPSAKERAQSLLREGVALYERGDPAAALSRFEAAFAIFPSPKILLNQGQALRDLKRPVEAMDAFVRFLTEAKDAPPEATAEARRMMAELQAQLGRIRISSPTSGAVVLLDGKQVGATPLSKLLWVTPGRHRIRLDRASFWAATRDVDVGAGAVETASITLRPIDAASPHPPVNADPGGLRALEPGPAGGDIVVAPESNASITRRPWFWVAIGGAVVLGTVVVIAASSSSRTPVPETSLGAQPGFR